MVLYKTFASKLFLLTFLLVPFYMLAQPRPVPVDYVTGGPVSYVRTWEPQIKTKNSEDLNILNPLR